MISAKQLAYGKPGEVGYLHSLGHPEPLSLLRAGTKLEVLGPIEDGAMPVRVDGQFETRIGFPWLFQMIICSVKYDSTNRDMMVVNI